MVKPETRLPYAVVEFTAVNEVEVVPTNWLTGGEKQCYWPNRFKAGKLSLAVKNAVAPSHEFKPLAVRVLYKGSYDQARRKLALAELTSDLQTDDENTTSKRVACPNPRCESGTEESEEEEDVSSRPKKARKSPPPPPPPPPVISLQIPTTPRSSERTGACPSVAPSCLSPLPATGGSASATPSTSGSSALPSLFDKTPDRNIGASAIDRKLLTQIEEIKVKVNLNTKLLHALMRKIDNIGSSCTEDNTELLDQTFPLATRQDIHYLESRLDEELKGNLIKILSGIGGETLKATVRRLLTYMIKNDLAKQINWKGKGDKIAFTTLKLKDLLIKWFRYAADREGGRKLREEKKRAREAAVEQTTDDEDHGS
ncbi:uncharacterized protein [Magallana gigas]|uniref:uncharacterized protein n=1 Tax=Magallana gigas TaxID=29159 RepID=UPI00333F1A67